MLFSPVNCVLEITGDSENLLQIKNQIVDNKLLNSFFPKPQELDINSGTCIILKCF